VKETDEGHKFLHPIVPADEPVKETDEGHEFLHPLVPADAGTQALPDPKSLRSGNGWVPASAGISGRGNSSTSSEMNFIHVPEFDVNPLLRPGSVPSR
jgi:hypothetical protein